MKNYLVINNSNLPSSEMYIPGKYNSPGIYLNTPTNQVIAFDGHTVFALGSPGILGKLPVVESIEEHKVDPNLLSNSLLKLAAIMQDASLAKELI